jgi:hypothetical protein
VTSPVTTSLPNPEPLILPPPSYHIEDECPTQTAIRDFLSVGNAIGLQFSDDAWSQGMAIAPLSVSWPAFPLTASVNHTKIAFDELLVAVLLQACLRGSAAMFWVQKITSYCFRFFVHSIDAMHTILHQYSIRARRFTLVFDHIHLAPNQIPPQTSVTTNLPSDALASTTTRAAEHLHFSTIAVSEVDDTLLEGFSVSGPLKMGLWLVLSVLGQFSVL